MSGLSENVGVPRWDDFCVPKKVRQISPEHLPEVVHLGRALVCLQCVLCFLQILWQQGRGPKKAGGFYLVYARVTVMHFHAFPAMINVCSYDVSQCASKLKHFFSHLLVDFRHLQWACLDSLIYGSTLWRELCPLIWYDLWASSRLVQQTFDSSTTYSKHRTKTKHERES